MTARQAWYDDDSETYLDSVQLLLRPIPLVRESHNRSGTFADGEFLTDTILFAQAGGRVSCGALRTTATTGVPIVYGVSVGVGPTAGPC